MIRSMLAGIVLAVALACAAAGPLYAQDFTHGQRDYERYCVWCHGANGDGRGPSARRAEPVPRDFTAAVFKCTSTPSGTLPTDDDLRRSVRGGLHGTGMPSWSVLGPLQIDDLVASIKRYSSRWTAEPPGTPVVVPPEPARSAESVRRGEGVYSHMKCTACHGEGGRGLGPASQALRDDVGDPIRPANLTQLGAYRCGTGGARMYTTLMTGLGGTPMPSYAAALAADEAWDLVHYLQALGPDATRTPAPPRQTLAPPPPSAGPSIEVPADEGDQVTTELPRETPVENALGRVPAVSGTAIGGYGELTLNAPGNAPAIVDMRRLVLFFGHNFSERLRFYSEVEVEHAVASSGDQGEAEIEQAYLDGLLHRRFNLRGGLILMPVGIVNIYHEPPTFNGVDRPDVDTFVIPSTWREPGFGAFGEISEGLRYQLYLVNGFNANGFSAESGIREGHQEAQLARARDFGAVARLDYEPVLGTSFGVSAYGATSGNSLRDTVGRVPVGLFELDARTRLGGFTARAEVAVLLIGQAGALNRALAAGSSEQMAAGPVSAQSRGGYLEAGYDTLRLLAPNAKQALTLFMRYDYVDTQADVPAGYGARREFVRHTMTGGVVYRPVPQIGLKVDYRRHELGEGPGFHEMAAAITWMF